MWYGIFNSGHQRMIYNNFSCITWFITVQKVFSPTILRIKYKLFTIAYKPLRALPLFPTLFPNPLSSLTTGRYTGLLPVLQKAPSSLVECGRLSLECCSPCPWYVCLFFILWVSAYCLTTSSKRSSLTTLYKLGLLILSEFYPGYLHISQIKIICLLLEYLPLWTAITVKVASAFWIPNTGSNILHCF